MNQDRLPPVRDLVLVGGGHAHVQVVKSLGMRALDGVRVTLISRESETPYSGMLPAHIAGHYDAQDIHIDLGPLCQFAGVRLIADEVIGLDANQGVLHFAQRPALHYHLLSLNLGAVPEPLGDGVVPVKPIGKFLPSWNAVKAQLVPGNRVVLVGAGAGGVELAFAMRQVLQPQIDITLVGAQLLPDAPPSAVQRVEQLFAEVGIEWIQARVTEAGAQGVTLADGTYLSAHTVFSVTGVRAPAWLADTGLDVDARGFVQVQSTLASQSHPGVFAVGDVACLVGQERPKSGVYAVRAGQVLTDNLRRAAASAPLREFRAQRQALSLLGVSNGEAIAIRGSWVTQGRWVWRWKQWIDERFMARFNRLPQMLDTPAVYPGNLAEDAPQSMRCGGCGAKLAAEPLRRVLARLPAQTQDNLELGFGDDAALVRTQGERTLMSVDGFRAFVDDPYLLGRICAHHAMNDVFAMGGEPTSALALATIPTMGDALVEEDLFQLLSGTVAVLNAHGVSLVGGHSAEGLELALGLTLSGRVVEPMMTKGGLHPGDALILTRPLGTGVLLAANMRGDLRSTIANQTLLMMDVSNAAAVPILRVHGAQAATDVTGFGLLGHLTEMLRASNCGAIIQCAQIPLLEGALEQMQRNTVSALQSSNELAINDFEILGALDARLRLCADPQTSGGLLVGVSADRADACVAELQQAGYMHAARIGEIDATQWQLNNR